MPPATFHTGTDPLPPGIRARFVAGVNGLTMHLLEAGFEAPGRPLVLLLHGFPELAYSWRKVMLPLAQAGFHVIAPDQRGYGRSTGWDGRFDGDLDSCRMLNLVTDALALVHALGQRAVHTLVGHDFGSFVAALAALVRPDVFRSVVLMSAPFGGAPALPFDIANSPATATASPAPVDPVHAALAALPRPRKHYQWYFSTRAADADMHDCPQGIHDFLRAYYHFKSADCRENQPFPLAAWSAQELAKMPTYYIMDLEQTMAQTVAPHMPTPAQIAANPWLPDDELRVYSRAFAHTRFQGALNWYRCLTSAKHAAELRLFAGRTIDVPSMFIAGASDWGIYQKPGGDIRTLQQKVLTRMDGGLHLVDGAGHWVQQEQPQAVVRLLLPFLQRPLAQAV